jgi:hypothetical protein
LGILLHSAVFCCCSHGLGGADLPPQPGNTSTETSRTESRLAIFSGTLETL